MGINWQQMMAAPPVGDVESEQRRLQLQQALQERALQGTAPRSRGRVTAKYSTQNALTDVAGSLVASRNVNKAEDRVTQAKDAKSARLNQAIAQYMESMGGGATGPSVGPGGKAIPAAPNPRRDAVMALTQAGGLSTQEGAVNAMTAEALKPPPLREYKAFGKGGIYESNTGDVKREPDTKDKWKRETQPLPDGSGKVQDYVLNEADGKWEKWNSPYKPVDTTPNTSIRLGGDGPPPRWVQAQDPNDPNKMIWVNLNNQQAPSRPSGKETDQGAREGKQNMALRGVEDFMKEAEDLLSGTVRDASGAVDPTQTGEKPTGSPVGKVWDILGRSVGMSPEGSIPAKRLEVIGGWLTSKVPRFEGPQSDRDTAAYRTMAAEVGDATVPVDQRLAGLRQLMTLIAGYRARGQDVFAEAGGRGAVPGASPAAPSGGGTASFATEDQAAAAGLKPGTPVIIGGVKGTWQ